MAEVQIQAKIRLPGLVLPSSVSRFLDVIFARGMNLNMNVLLKTPQRRHFLKMILKQN